MNRIIEKNEPEENTVICNNCKNHISGQKCKAFDFIPNLILNGENDHKTPLRGQKNKIVFEPID
jgi:hypothetical protein